MKTKPMRHQTIGCALLASHDVYAMGAEQGTGKTWMLLQDVEQRFLAGKTKALLVIAPNGVHTNWVTREIPRHLEVPVCATFWLSGATKRHNATLQRQLRLIAEASSSHDQQPLHVHAINIDAINTKSGYAHVETFLKAFPADKVVIVIDESHKIKNIAAKRTQKTLALDKFAKVRRIASGTLVADSPLDLFSQYEFLGEGLLGTKSYRAFVAEYAELIPANSELVRSIVQRTGARGSPQIVARNADGTLRFRNVAKLQRLMAPYTFRVTKEECLDLPAKIYQTVSFELDPEQERAYQHVVSERNWLRDDGKFDTFSALTVITKLRQITSGFMLLDGVPLRLVHAAPRLAALMDTLESHPGPVIVWASFREEIVQIAAALRAAGVTFREYYGDTKPADRTAAINDFQSGAARVFLGNPAAAGTGLTLTAAETAIYYSSSFSLNDRSQSEDRCHRIGTTHHVLYIDIVARGTIDERIASALQSKKLTAELVMSGLAEVDLA
jgi:SNF2 family DNA or RNA helicase